jgi:DNA repair exonuclease SbcCD ATPase subunit
MATATGKARCITCGKERIAYKCEGCLEYFCVIHLPEHHQIHGKELEEIENQRNIFREILIEQKTNPEKHSLIEQIHQWKRQSIDRIETTAKEAERLLLKPLHEHINQIEIQLKDFTEQLQKIREENDFNEIILSQLKKKLKELEEQLNKPSNISIQQDSSSFIKRISVVIFPRKCFRNIYPHKKIHF